MENRLRSLPTMKMGVKLPLPAENRQIRVEIAAPTYRSVEVEHKTDNGIITAIDFPALYEWASREARITGYSKLYLLGGYLVNYCNGSGEPTEGVEPNYIINLQVELGEGITLQTLDLQNGDEFMGNLYQIIRDYEGHIQDMLFASDIEDIQMEERINWQVGTEALPALPGEVAPVPVEEDPFDWEEEPLLPDLIDLGDGDYISRGKLIAEYARLKRENQELCELRDSKYGKYVQLFQQMMAGNDSGVGFVSLCLEEIQTQLHHASNTTDCFAALRDSAIRMEEGAKLWNAMAETLKALTPQPVPSVPEQRYKIVSNDFRDVSQFVFACAGYAQDEKQPLRIRVFKDSLDKEVGEFDWHPTDAGMGYNPQEAKALLLATLMEAAIPLTSGCHHLAAFAPNSDICIAAHTVWL